MFPQLAGELEWWQRRQINEISWSAAEMLFSKREFERYKRVGVLGLRSAAFLCVSIVYTAALPWLCALCCCAWLLLSRHATVCKSPSTGAIAPVPVVLYRLPQLGFWCVQLALPTSYRRICTASPPPCSCRTWMSRGTRTLRKPGGRRSWWGQHQQHQHQRLRRGRSRSRTSSGAVETCAHGAGGWPW